MPAARKKIPAPNTVTWSGGPLGGAEIACSTRDLAQRIGGMRVRITPTGRVFDQTTSRPVSGVEVVKLPTALRPTRRTRRS